MPRPKRAEPRRGTDQALIEAAEQLFAEHGIEAASLRQIATAAGSANSFAVQYHFGGRDELVTAIFEHRLGQMERRRVEMLAELDPARRDLRALLDISWRPLVEQVDARGRHSYAAFLMSLRRSQRGLDRRLAAAGLAPVMGAVIAEIRGLAPHLSRLEFERRMGMSSTLLFDGLCRHDAGDAAYADKAAVLDEALTAGVALFEAPGSGTI